MVGIQEESEIEVIIGVEVDVDAGLCAVKLHDLLVIRRLLHRLVISVANEARESEGNALFWLYLTLGRQVHGAEG